MLYFMQYFYHGMCTSSLRRKQKQLQCCAQRLELAMDWTTKQSSFQVLPSPQVPYAHCSSKQMGFFSTLCSVTAFCVQHFGSVEMVLLWTVLIGYLKQICRLWALETDVVRCNTLVFRRKRIPWQQTCDLMQKHQVMWTGWAAWSQGLNR